MPRTSVGTLVAVIVAGVVLAAQQASGPLVFRTGTDLVTVDALVTDSHGNAVTGLTADDFRITEHGRPQKISALTFVTTPLVERQEFDPVPVAPVRDVVTNYVAPHSRAYAIVVDDLHLMEFHREAIQRVLTDLIGSIPATDRVAVIFTGRSDLSVDLTDDRAAELQAVGRIRQALGFALDLSPVACGALEAQRKHQALGALDVLRNVSTVLAHTRADERTVVFLSEGLNYDFSAMSIGPVQAVLNARSASALSTQTERHCNPDGTLQTPTSKSTLPGDPQENPADAQAVREALQGILDAARRADVRIYTIDPRGSVPWEAEVRGYADASKAQAMFSKQMVQNDSLRTVASETGALAAVERSDLHGAVREVLADTGSYYLLGYTPDPLARDGQYHEIDVNVLRAGLHVRARKGYTAPELNPHPPTGAQALSADLTSGDATADFTLAGFVAPLAADGKFAKTAVTIEVTYPGPAVLPASIADDLQCEILDADVEGGAKVVATHAYHFDVTPTRPGDVVFFINTVVNLAPGLANLRVGVMSKATGKVGTLAIPVRVPNLSDDALQVATVVLGVDGAAEPALPAAALAGLVPFQPTLRRTFSTHDTLRIFAPVSWGGKAAAAAATVTVSGTGIELSQPLSSTSAASASGPHRASIDQRLPLSSLAVGAHVLTVTVTLPGGKPVSKTIGFQIDR